MLQWDTDQEDYVTYLHKKSQNDYYLPFQIDSKNGKPQYLFPTTKTINQELSRSALEGNL